MALGAWPCPKLDKPFTLFGLTKDQWLYAGVAYYLWSKGNALLESLAVPFWVKATWFVLCAVAGALATFLRWHGLGLWAFSTVAMDFASTPKLSVWRPLDLGWDEREEDDDEDDTPPLVETVPTPDNPAGWDIGILGGRQHRRAALEPASLWLGDPGAARAQHQERASDLQA